MKTPALTILAAFVLSSSVLADAWPQWRGPKRDDVSNETGLLKQWPADGPKVDWIYKEAGLGYSGFSVVGGKLFTMGSLDKVENVICLDAKSGKKLWASPLGEEYDNNWGNGPRGTPTVDGDKVYALSALGMLGCYNLADGKEVWKVSLQKDLGGKLQGWGYTESPLVDGDKVICTPGGDKGSMAALDKKTGKVLWQSSDVKDDAQYSSPIIVEFGGQKQYVNLLMKKVISVNPADGKLLWDAEFNGRVAVIPTLIYNDGQIFITAGYGAGCKSIKMLPGNKTEEVYKDKAIGNHHGGVVLHKGNLYGHSESGGWTCQEFTSGKILWQEKGKLGKGATAFADGHLYCVDEKSGAVVLLEATDKGYTEVSRFTLTPQTKLRKPEGRIWTHPVISDGHLYLRDQEMIFSFSIKG